MKKQLLLVSVLCLVTVWVGCGGAASFGAPPAAPGGTPNPPAPPPPPSLQTFYLYVANRGSSDITAYSFQFDGSSISGLTSIGSIPVPSPPVALAFTQIDELFNYVFVATETAQILSYKVDPPTGTLNVVSTVAGHGQPVAISVGGSNRFIYVGNAVTNNVSVFSLDSNGALTPLSGSPFATGLAEVRSMGGHGAQNQFLTVVGNGGVADFPLDASGHLGTPTLTTANVPADIQSMATTGGLVYLLSAAGVDAYIERSVPGNSDCLDVPFDCKLTATPLPVGSQPSFVSASETGVFVSNAGSHDLTAYRVSDDGGLGVSFTPLANTPTGLGPSSTYPYWPPSFVWVTNELSNSLSLFRFNTDDNTLTQVSGSPVATGTGPVAVAIP